MAVMVAHGSNFNARLQVLGQPEHREWEREAISSKLTKEPWPPHSSGGLPEISKQLFYGPCSVNHCKSIINSYMNSCFLYQPGG